jgi:hypothetical protein
LSRHRHRFEAYLDKVFGFSDLVSALPEGRQFPQHSWKKVFDAVFLGAAMQMKPNVTTGRWPNASDRSATTPSPIRSKDKLPNRCFRSVVKLLAA